MWNRSRNRNRFAWICSVRYRWLIRFVRVVKAPLPTTAQSCNGKSRIWQLSKCFCCGFLQSELVVDHSTERRLRRRIDSGSWSVFTIDGDGCVLITGAVNLATTISVCSDITLQRGFRITTNKIKINKNINQRNDCVNYWFYYQRHQTRNDAETARLMS